jgi:hypothetical protein
MLKMDTPHVDSGQPTAVAFVTDCFALAEDQGAAYWLGAHTAPSPWLALFWLVWRAGHIADQLDPPAARPVRAWIVDGREHARALRRLSGGETYAFLIRDGAMHYVLSATPSSDDNGEGEACT